MLKPTLCPALFKMQNDLEAPITAADIMSAL